MSGTLPTTPAFRTYRLTSKQPVFVDYSQSNRRHSRKTSAHLWNISVTWPTLSSDELWPIFAFLLSQDGEANSFQLSLPDKNTPNGLWGGTPLVNGASQTGNTLLIDGGSGTNLLSDSGFDTGTPWSALHWTIGSGVATHDIGWGNTLYQSVSLTAETYYVISYTVASRTVGTVKPYFGGTATSYGTAVNSNGTHYELIQAVSGNTLAGIIPSADFDGSIDDFTLYEANYGKRGDIFTIGGDSKVYMLTQDAGLQSDGQSVELNFIPELQTTPSDNAAITSSNVQFTVAVDVQEISYDIEPGLLYTLTLNFVEHLS